MKNTKFNIERVKSGKLENWLQFLLCQIKTIGIFPLQELLGNFTGPG